MSNRTLAIVFRNAHPHSTPVRSELFLLPRKSLGLAHFTGQTNFADPGHLGSRNAANDSKS